MKKPTQIIEETDLIKEKLYCYLRVSSMDQVSKDLSLPRQEQLGRKKAADLGLDPIILIEAGKSASKEDFDNRPKMVELIQLVKDGRVKHLFVFDLSRLSRNTITKAIIIDTLRKNKVEVHTFSKPYDFGKEEDILTFTILQAIESYESALRKARFQLGYIVGNQKGRYLKGIPPYGYKKDETGKLIIDEEEKLVLLEIVDLYLNHGYGTNKIANYLNDKNIKTKTSKILKNGYTLKKGSMNRMFEKHIDNNRWNAGTINSMLKNNIYSGFRKFKTGEDNYEYVFIEPIISEEKFELIQLTREFNSVRKTKGLKYFYLLKGFMMCGNCKSNMHGRVKPTRGEYTYRCNSKRDINSNCGSVGINITKLEQIVWYVFSKTSIFEKFINSETLTSDTPSEIQREIDEQNRLLETYLKQEIRVRKRIELTVRNSAISELPEKSFKKIINEFKTEEKIVSDNISSIKSRLTILGAKSQRKSTFKLDKAESLKKSTPPFESSVIQNLARDILNKALGGVTVKYLPDERTHVINIQFNPIRKDNLKGLESSNLLKTPPCVVKIGREEKFDPDKIRIDFLN